MMGERRVVQDTLFYGFSLERHVPDHHLLRKIDRFVDLTGLRAHLGPYYSDVGRPSTRRRGQCARASRMAWTEPRRGESADCIRCADAGRTLSH